jgi:hypothetical protein
MTSRFIRDYADNQITLLKQVGDVATLMDFIDVSRNTNINSLLLRGSLVTDEHLVHLAEALQTSSSKSGLSFIDLDSTTCVSMSAVVGLLELTDKLNLSWNTNLEKEV